MFNSVSLICGPRFAFAITLIICDNFFDFFTIMFLARTNGKIQVSVSQMHHFCLLNLNF